MAEEVKKAPKPVDPNSAKYKLGKIAADAYVDAIEAKKRGEKVAWVSSNFPVEIPETMGIATVYPENQAAGIAARGEGGGAAERGQEQERQRQNHDFFVFQDINLLDMGMPPLVERHPLLLALNNRCGAGACWGRRHW